jgi:hypothetical protein
MIHSAKEDIQYNHTDNYRGSIEAVRFMKDRTLLMGGVAGKNRSIFVASNDFWYTISDPNLRHLIADMKKIRGKDGVGRNVEVYTPWNVGIHGQRELSAYDRRRPPAQHVWGAVRRDRAVFHVCTT